MNILLFVMSLLMILALLTYGRLDMYRSFVVTQGEFERYMADGERNAFNTGAQQWYDWTTLSSKNGPPKKPAPRDASPQLSISWLLHTNAQGQEVNPEIKSIYRELLKKVIYNVFREQKEFKQALDKNPNLVDDLLNAIEAAGTKLKAEKKSIKTTDGLENLDLENPSLQDVYYWMVKGYKIQKPHDEKPGLHKPIIEITEEAGDREDSADNQSEEHVHQEGNLSLLDFVTVNPQKTKIRVFLAPQAILQAVFGDPHTVEEIMQSRIEMYHQIRNDKESDSLTQQFKEKFLSRAMNVPETLLNFTVTGTDPRNYEVQ